MSSSRPHCMLVTTSYPADTPTGGEAAGVFVKDFAASLAEQVDVTVVAPASRAGERREGALRTVYFPTPRLPLSLLDLRRPGDWPAIFSTLRAGSAAVDKCVARERPAHVMALWTLPCGAWVRAASMRYGVPYSTWALGSDIWTLGRIPVVRSMLRLVLRGATMRYADGEKLRRDVEALADRPCEFLASARRLPCRARSEFRSTPPYRLAFLARWHPNKGADLLLDALQRLDEQDWCLIEGVRIAGGGPLEGAVKAGVAALRASGRPIDLRGFIGPEQAAEYLEWADWLMIPSRIESIPVVFSDALQAGCAVVATPVGDLGMLIDQHGVGVQAARPDAESFAAALRSALRRTPAEFATAITKAGARFNVRESARRFLTDCNILPAEAEELADSREGG